MKLRFTNENGASYLGLTLTETERNVLDERLAAIGLTRGKVTKPCQMVSEEVYQCWKGAERSLFLNSVRQGMRHTPIVFRDGINDPLFDSESINLAVLRICIPAGQEARFKLVDGFASPEAIENFSVGLTEAFRSLYMAQANSEVSVTFTVRRR